MDDVRLDGKTVVITGANTGIGKETAKGLARRGARVILACRSQQRAEDARQEIVDDTGNENVVVKLLDLASLKSIKSFADDYNQTEDRLDILVNNAGVYSKLRKETEDGHELMFGVNHLGHFYLTTLLLEKLKSSAPSRVVLVSSRAHRFGSVNFEDLHSTRGYSTFKTYGRSKSANILFAVQLAKNLEGTGVTTYALEPGYVKTEIEREFDENRWQARCLACLLPLFCVKTLTREEGARTTLYCCLEPTIALHSGRYYSESKEKPAKGYATNAKNAARLWDISEQLCGMRD